MFDLEVAHCRIKYLSLQHKITKFCKMQEKKKTNALDHAKMAEHSEINKETEISE